MKRRTSGEENDELAVNQKVQKKQVSFRNVVKTKSSRDKEQAVIKLVWGHDVARIKQFLDEGVSPNLTVPFMQHRSLLHIAQHNEVVELLIKEGANVNAETVSGLTPLFCANLPEKIDLLVQHGADIGHKDHNGETALFHMTTPECIEQLLRNGAELHHENINGETAIFKAKTREVAQTLISKGLDVSHKNKDGRTPIFFAATHDIAALLLHYGANESHVDNNGETPIFRARYTTTQATGSSNNDEASMRDRSRADITSLLIKKGAKATHVNRYGKTASEVWKEEVFNTKRHFQERGYSSEELNRELLEPINMAISAIESSPDFRIAQMDQEAETRFEEAICNGYSPFRYGTVTLIGPFGVGKTTLVHGLLNDDLSDFPSTDGIEFHDGRCRFLIKSGVWETGDLPFKMESKLGDVMEFVRKRARDITPSEHDEEMDDSEEAMTGCETTESMHHQPTQDSVDGRLLTGQQNGNESVHDSDDGNESIHDSETRNEDQGENIMLREFMKKAVEIDKKNPTDRYATIQFRDFAGQAAFYTTHNLFLTSNSLYLLVFDVSLELSSIVEDKDLDPEKKIEQPVSEFLLYWAKVIHFNTTSELGSFPRIIIVGTHVDQIEQEKRENHVKQQFAELRKLFADHPVLTRHLIIDEKNVVNGKNHDHEGYVRLKSIIMREVQKYPSFGRLIPTNWIPIEYMMQAIKNEKQVLSMKGVKEINRQWKHPLTDDQLLNFLLTQHSEGNLIYFNEPGLDDHVLLNQKGIIDALRLLITPETFWSKDPKRREPWRLLKETGQIPEEKIIIQWRNSPQLKENQDFLLNLMERLDLLVKPKVYENGCHKSVDYYIIPCMLNRTVTDTIVSKYVSDSRHGLVFTFQFLTQAIFHRLMTTFIATFPIVEEIRGRQVIYSTFCVFLVDKFHQVSLKMEDNSIKIWIRHRRGWQFVSDLVCFSINKFLTENIAVITRGYNREVTVNMADMFKKEMMFFCNNQDSGCKINLTEIPANSNRCQCKVHKRDFHAVWTYIKTDSEKFSNNQYCPDECEGLRGNRFKDGEITEVEFGRLSRRICSYYQLGIELGVLERDRKKIEVDYGSYGNSAIVHQYLLKWQKQEGRRKATMHKLQQHLLNLHKMGDIEDLHCLCEVYFPERRSVEQMNETISDEQLDQLSLSVGREVLHLATELGLSSAIVDRIRLDTKSTLEQIRKIFEVWKNSREEKHLSPRFENIALAFIEVGIGLDPILELQEPDMIDF